MDVNSSIMIEPVKTSLARIIFFYFMCMGSMHYVCTVPMEASGFQLPRGWWESNSGPSGGAVGVLNG